MQLRPLSTRLGLCSVLSLAYAGSAGAVLAVTNGDFEADDVPADSEGGAVDITGWFESDPIGNYVEWLRDDADMGAPDGGAGGVGIAENNNWFAMSGNTAGAGVDGSYIFQSIGTLEAGETQIEVSGVSSDRGDRPGTGRHSAIVDVSLWYDDGSAVLADGTSLEATSGLGLIGFQTVGASVGGTFSSLSGPPDIDLTTLDPAGQALSEAWSMQFDLAGTGITAGDTVYLQFRYFDSDLINSRSEAYLDNIEINGGTVTPLPGDTDGDGDIDNSDLQKAIANFTGPQPTPPTFTKTAADGDTNGDGDVDNGDLQAAIAGFTGPINPAPVPEPASLGLLALGGVMALRRRR